MCYAKKIITSAELQKKIEEIDMVGVDVPGRKVVVEAWTNPEFKAALLKNAREAIESLGITIGKVIRKVPCLTVKYDIVAVENTDQVHNLVVCTLCSCYPRYLLGRPPDWYKSRSYRARSVIEPRKVLEGESLLA